MPFASNSRVQAKRTALVLVTSAAIFLVCACASTVQFEIGETSVEPYEPTEATPLPPQFYLSYQSAFKTTETFNSLEDALCGHRGAAIDKASHLGVLLSPSNIEFAPNVGTEEVSFADLARFGFVFEASNKTISEGSDCFVSPDAFQVFEEAKVSEYDEIVLRMRFLQFSSSQIDSLVERIDTFLASQDIVASVLVNSLVDEVIQAHSNLSSNKYQRHIRARMQPHQQLRIPLMRTDGGDSRVEVGEITVIPRVRRSRFVDTYTSGGFPDFSGASDDDLTQSIIDIMDNLDQGLENGINVTTFDAICDNFRTRLEGFDLTDVDEAFAIARFSLRDKVLGEMRPLDTFQIIKEASDDITQLTSEQAASLVSRLGDVRTAIASLRARAKASCLRSVVQYAEDTNLDFPSPSKLEDLLTRVDELDGLLEPVAKLDRIQFIERFHRSLIVLWNEPSYPVSETALRFLADPLKVRFDLERVGGEFQELDAEAFVGRIREFERPTSGCFADLLSAPGGGDQMRHRIYGQTLPHRHFILFFRVREDSGISNDDVLYALRGSFERPEVKFQLADRWKITKLDISPAMEYEIKPLRELFEQGGSSDCLRSGLLDLPS